MDARFNSLTRKARYTFCFTGQYAVTGVFHEILPDGTLKVAGNVSGVKTPDVFYLNPDTIVYAREDTPSGL